MICHSHKTKHVIDKYHPLEKVEVIIIDKWFQMDSPHLYDLLSVYVEGGHCPLIMVDHAKMEEWFGESDQNCFVIYDFGGNKSHNLELYMKYLEMY